jgi:hypothetical protein
MRLELYIDGMRVGINTRDPELLGRWLLEQFATIHWTPATDVRAQAWPSWSDMDEQGQARPDWVTITPILCRQWEVKSPEDVLAGLATQLKEAAEWEASRG